MKTILNVLALLVIIFGIHFFDILTEGTYPVVTLAASFTILLVGLAAVDKLIKD